MIYRKGQRWTNGKWEARVRAVDDTRVILHFPRNGKNYVAPLHEADEYMERNHMHLDPRTHNAEDFRQLIRIVENVPLQHRARFIIALRKQGLSDGQTFDLIDNLSYDDHDMAREAFIAIGIEPWTWPFEKPDRAQSRRAGRAVGRGLGRLKR